MLVGKGAEPHLDLQTIEVHQATVVENKKDETLSIFTFQSSFSLSLPLGKCQLYTELPYQMKDRTPHILQPCNLKWSRLHSQGPEFCSCIQVSMRNWQICSQTLQLEVWPLLLTRQNWSFHVRILRLGKLKIGRSDRQNSTFSCTETVQCSVCDWRLPQ